MDQRKKIGGKGKATARTDLKGKIDGDDLGDEAERKEGDRVTMKVATNG